ERVSINCDLRTVANSPRYLQMTQPIMLSRCERGLAIALVAGICLRAPAQAPSEAPTESRVAGAILEGAITDSDGWPVAGAEVRDVSGERPNSTVTDNVGRFRLAVAAPTVMHRTFVAASHDRRSQATIRFDRGEELRRTVAVSFVLKP